MRRWRRLHELGAAVLVASALAGCAHAQRGEARFGRDTGATANETPPGLPRLEVAYGDDPRQRLDVYRPPSGVRGAEASVAGAPILVMVHGGGWAIGNKRAPGVVGAKATHWVARGWVLVSVGYRLQPEQPPAVQIDDVARALARIARDAPAWGADPSRLVLMGHSAGPHLVAALAADPSAATALGARRWAAGVLLDGAAYDVEALFARRHAPLYDRAFGADPAAWRAASPTERLRPGSVPMLMVCSSRRRLACDDAQAFAERVRAVGGHAELHREARTHRAINAELGEPGAYTDAVDRFIARWVVAVTPR